MNIGSFVINVEYTVEQIDELINMLNQPLGVPTVTWAKHIDLLQRQVRPQVEHMKTNIEAVKSATEKMDESKTTT
jgi:hypothetical protein